MWPDQVSQDWGEWSPASYVDNSTYGGSADYGNTPITTTAADQASADRWSGWFQQLAGTVVNYAIAKDARESGVTPVQYVNGQPVQVRQSSGVGLAVLAAAAVGAVLLLKRG